MLTLYHGSYTTVSQPLAIGQLRYKEVNHQLCVLNQTVIDQHLEFVESFVMKTEEDMK